MTLTLPSVIDLNLDLDQQPLTGFGKWDNPGMMLKKWGGCNGDGAWEMGECRVGLGKYGVLVLLRLRERGGEGTVLSFTVTFLFFLLLLVHKDVTWHRRTLLENILFCLEISDVPNELFEQHLEDF